MEVTGYEGNQCRKKIRSLVPTFFLVTTTAGLVVIKLAWPGVIESEFSHDYNKRI